MDRLALAIAAFALLIFFFIGGILTAIALYGPEAMVR